MKDYGTIQANAMERLYSHGFIQMKLQDEAVHRNSVEAINLSLAASSL